MFSRRHRAALGLAAAGLLALSACQGGSGSDDRSASGGNGSGDTTAAAGTSAAASGVYGAPVDPSAPDPTDLATDGPAGAPSPTGSVAPLELTWSAFDEPSGTVQVDGYVPGIAADGTCTLTLTQGSLSARAVVPGAVNRTDTDCGGAAVPRAELAPGVWTAVLSFSAPSVEAASDPVEVTVP